MYHKVSQVCGNTVPKSLSSYLKASQKSVRAMLHLSDINQDYTLDKFLESPGHWFRNARNSDSMQKGQEKCLASQITHEQERVSNWASPTNILWRSRYGRFDDSLDYMLFQRIRMTDFLVFNKNYEVDDEKTMERCLGACFFEHKKGLDHCIVDGWEVYGDFNYNKINYHDNFNYSAKTLVQSDFGKLVAARAIITIMNETKIEELNLANYFWLEKWLTSNEWFLQSLDPIRITDQLCKSQTDEIKDSDLVLALDHVLTPEYVQNIIDENLKSTFRNGITNLDLKAPTYQIKVVNDQVNLSDLRELFSPKDLKRILFNLKRYKNDHLYCDVPAEKMLMELYNTRGPTGLGVLHFNRKSLTEDEARELLQKQTYFDYLNGVRMKINFDKYPLLKIERYDRDYGEGSAKKALENVRLGQMSCREDQDLIHHT